MAFVDARGFSPTLQQRTRDLRPIIPFVHLGLRIAFDVLRPKPQVERADLRCVISHLRYLLGKIIRNSLIFGVSGLA
jgi:hypothetical protein